MKKTEVKVTIKSKEEALNIKSILIGLEEPVLKDYFMGEDVTSGGFDQSSVMIYEGKWNCCNKFVAESLIEVSIRELIKIISLESSAVVEKPIAVIITSEDELEIYNRFRKSLGFNGAGLIYSHDTVIHQKDFNSFNSELYTKKADYNILSFADFCKKFNVEQPLVKTHDGVFLYRGDSYYRTYNGIFGLEHDKVCNLKESHAVVTGIEGAIAWHTEKAQQDYVNKKNKKEVEHMTVDGVVLKENETYVQVVFIFGSWDTIPRAIFCGKDSPLVRDPDNHKAFNSVEKAKEWCENMNKPEFIIVGQNTSIPAKVSKLGVDYFPDKNLITCKGLRISPQELKDISEAYEKVRE